MNKWVQKSLFHDVLYFGFRFGGGDPSPVSLPLSVVLLLDEPESEPLAGEALRPPPSDPASDSDAEDDDSDKEDREEDESLSDEVSSSVSELVSSLSLLSLLLSLQLLLLVDWICAFTFRFSLGFF